VNISGDSERSSKSEIVLHSFGRTNEWVKTIPTHDAINQIDHITHDNGGFRE